MAQSVSPLHQSTQNLNTRTAGRKDSLASGTLDFLAHARFSQPSALATRRATNIEHPVNSAAAVQALPRPFDNDPSALDAPRAQILHESNNEPAYRPQQRAPDCARIKPTPALSDQCSDQDRDNPTDEVFRTRSSGLIIRQTGLSSHFGMIGQRFVAVDESVRFITAIFVPPSFGCKDLFPNLESQLQNLPRRGARGAYGAEILPVLGPSALFRGYSRFLQSPRRIQE